MFRKLKVYYFTSLFFLLPLQGQIYKFSGGSAFEYLEKQVSFGPRNPGSAGHSKCKQFLIDELKKYTSDVSTQDFLFKDTELNKSFVLTNIIARFKAKNPDSPVILLAAHWDSRPRADRDEDEKNKEKPIPGANDGASGVAVLLEVAKTLKQNPPPVNVDIVFFDGEDYGKSGDLDNYLLGSKHFAKNLPRTPYQYGLLLDMVGDKNLKLPKEGYSLRMLPDIVNKVWDRAKKLNLTAFQNRRGSEIIDDHKPLIEAGIPIINIIDCDLVGERYWHTLQDTPDKCSPESLLEVGTLVLSVIYDGL
ncbi:M28 family peptidase [candidate division KSB1 bacterium]